MLVSVHSQIDSVKAVLHNEGASDKMLGYDHHITGQLIEFLKPFKEATVDLESDKDPTLHLVLPWFYALKTHCTVRDNDEEDMKPLKQAADAFLEQKMCVSMLHKIATFMVANYRTLRKLTEDEKIEVYQAARQMCAEVSVQVPNHSNQETNPGPYKMAKFEDWAEEPPLLHDEVSRYLQEHCEGYDLIVLLSGLPCFFVTLRPAAAAAPTSAPQVKAERARARNLLPPVCAPPQKEHGEPPAQPVRGRRL
ncbi:uncharacterized protein LOC126455922 [Schistocerca serialis cubense]|uniref:uncharacterized protein LOC126455922 n=1 Tax=Schistocerca serialis cubense TaxID=2023355 RepID=UPI00214E7E44|nr:uncharacterized protein LOC126455922 [Schistocerca serialis cubense]